MEFGDGASFWGTGGFQSSGSSKTDDASLSSELGLIVCYAAQCEQTLPIPSPFDLDSPRFSTAALAQWVRAGGVLCVQGEYPGCTGMDTDYMNAFLSAIGSSMQFLQDRPNWACDGPSGGYEATVNQCSPVTAGLPSTVHGALSGNIAGGTAILNAPACLLEGQTERLAAVCLAGEQLGCGAVFAIADSNLDSVSALINNAVRLLDENSPLFFGPGDALYSAGGDWSTPDTWYCDEDLRFHPGSIPTEAQDVYILSGTMTGSGVCKNMYVGESEKDSAFMPAVGATTPTATGFTAQISNYDAAYTWDGTATAAGTVVVSGTGLITVTSVAPGTSSTATVTATRTGYEKGSVEVTVTSLAAALTPSLGTPAVLAGGFTVSITNYDAAYTWAGTATASGTVAIGVGGFVSVTGVAAGQRSRLTITTTKSNTVGGTANVTVVVD